MTDPRGCESCRNSSPEGYPTQLDPCLTRCALQPARGSCYEPDEVWPMHGPVEIGRPNGDMLQLTDEELKLLGRLGALSLEESLSLVRGLRNGAKLAEACARIDELQAVLTELVRLKDLKDEELRRRQRREVSIQRKPEALAVVDAMRSEFNRLWPKAWEEARRCVGLPPADRERVVRIRALIEESRGMPFDVNSPVTPMSAEQVAWIAERLKESEE